MLVLSRKIGERVVIGDGVLVEVVAIEGNKVKLGVTAAPSVPVHREEVFDKINDRRKDGGLRADMNKEKGGVGNA